MFCHTIFTSKSYDYLWYEGPVVSMVTEKPILVEMYQSRGNLDDVSRQTRHHVPFP